MSQTLLAVLAIVLASFVSFNQKRNAVNTYEHILQNEIEMAASGSLMSVMELVGGRSFDEVATPEEVKYWNRIPNSTAVFHANHHFGVYDQGPIGCNLEKPYLTPECDDIDDLDGIRGAIVHARLSSGRTIEFETDVDVDYVVDREIQTISEEPTNHKLVTITMRHPLLFGEEITLQRVFSYDAVKTEMNFESIYGALDTGDGSDT
ncbi:MAG TPA: hypothetical protein VK002_10160 [Rubricoccaceae bacterium]|jgi:hypothetical protein|nr:hypothetical protein [Rubricoccaceae bacterium]